MTSEQSGNSNPDVCSICFESYRNQIPKLLPCFHTFCQPCLEEMFRKAAVELAKPKPCINQTDKDSSDTGEDVVIGCPTCRKAILLPPGGVAEFQSNFYMQQEGSQGHVQPIICDVCEKNQVASHLCIKCQQKLGFHCHQTHDNSCQVTRQPTAVTTEKDEGVSQMLSSAQDQLKILQRAMAQRAEEEKELDKQQNILEDDLFMLYNDGLACLVEARNEILRKIKSHTETEQSKAKVEMDKLQGKHDVLSSFTSSDDVSSINTTDLKAALMPDSEVIRLQRKAEQVQHFKHTLEKKNTNAIVNDLKDLIFGSLELNIQIRDEVIDLDSQNFQAAVLLLQTCDEDKTVSKDLEKPRSSIADVDGVMKDRDEDLAKKVDFLMKQAAESRTERKKLHIENRSLANEIQTFRDKNSVLMQEMASMQVDNHKLMESFTMLETEFQNLSRDPQAWMQTMQNWTSTATEMQKEIQSPQSNALTGDGNSSSIGATGGIDPKSGSRETEVHAQRIQTQELKKQVLSLQKLVMEHGGKLSRLDTRVESLGHPVFFHARLDHDVRTRSIRPLIFKDVLSNVGGYYDESTGKFETSVSGTYLFLASVTPVDKAKPAEIGIVVSDYDDYGGEEFSDDEETEHAYVLNAGTNTTSTCQCVVHVNEGQNVFVKTESTPCSFKKYECYFSGMLLQPEISPIW